MPVTPRRTIRPSDSNDSPNSRSAVSGASPPKDKPSPKPTADKSAPNVKDKAANKSTSSATPRLYLRCTLVLFTILIGAYNYLEIPQLRLQPIQSLLQWFGRPTTRLFDREVYVSQKPVETKTATKPTSFDTQITPDRLVAIGDIHGSYDQFLRVLKLAGLVQVDPVSTPTKTNAKSTGRTNTQTNAQPSDVRWTAEPGTWVVQVGDVVDRGDDTILLYKLIANLTGQAKLAGGRFISTLGNHELMNIMGDLRYVTQGDYDSFGGPAKRELAWKRDGWLGKQVRTWDVIAMVGGTIFVHGGISEYFMDASIEDMNKVVKTAFALDDTTLLWSLPIFGELGPFWYRGYAMDPEPQICTKVNKMLNRYNASRIVMGHTPQLDGQILKRCNGSIYVIDVGISPWYGSNLAALEIKLVKDDRGEPTEKVTALYPKGKRVALS